ncbi:hypothetical protein HA402_004331 [Bradysia odoriphaga]|nr:hypothetical protein HA402_004331 [Bradysia odoriphaga]
MDAKSKSNIISDKIRQDGNKRFAKKDYFDALSKYNEATRYAELGSKQLGLCYGNRSAVFLKVKQYKACMVNIELARKNHFPDELLPKLREREIECVELMEKCQTPMEETWNAFFTMSYEPNPKFPYLADCLKLKKHKDGWFLAPDRDLKAGDIVAITKPFVQFPIDTSSYRCNYCLADKFMNFIPCNGCAEVMFCDEICMEKAMNEFHQFECGIDNPFVDLLDIYTLRVLVKCYSLFDGDRTKIDTFFTSNHVSSSVLTPFDFDLSDTSSVSSERNLLLTQLCKTQQYDKKDCQHAFYKIQPFLKHHPKLQAFVTQKLFVLAANYALGDAKRYKGVGTKKLSNNHQDMGRCVINYFGDAIDVCSNIIRYSCAPNMILHPYNGMIIWMVHYPVKANEWLTVAFNNTVFFEKSISTRLESDVFGVIAKCKCAACTGKWDRVVAALVTPIYIMRYTSDEAIEKFAEYCNEINKIAKPLGKECDSVMWFEISRFRWNVMNLGKASFWDTIKAIAGFDNSLEHLVAFTKFNE